MTGPEAILLEFLGLRFLSFLLNSRPDEVHDRLERGEALRPEQETVLGSLIRFLGSIAPSGDEEQFQVRLALSTLGEFDPSYDMSWAAAAHLQAGGTIDLPHDGSGIQVALTAMVRDVYPLFLLPSGDDAFAFPLTASLARPLYVHPERPRFEASVMADTSLSRLFPEEAEHSGRYGRTLRSSGRGGMLQLTMFGDALLQSAWQLASLEMETPGPLRLFEKALELLDVIRAAARGDEATIVSLVGITGVHLPKGETMTWQGGRLRPMTEFERALTPPGLSAKLSTTLQDGSEVTIDYAGDLVLVQDVPYRIRLQSLELGGEFPPDLLLPDPVSDAVEALRLGLLLANTRDPTPAIHPTWHVFIDPLSSGISASWNDARRVPGFVPAALSQDELLEWKLWSDRVATLRTSSIAVAVRRTLLAAAERPDPSDGLVDAVIAWENLFGSRRGEPTLRISAALAWLVADNVQDRAELQKTVSRLYNLRSEIVHGTRFLEPSQAAEKRGQAVRLTVSALRRLFGDRSELLSNCREGNERSLRLMLGG